MPLSRPATAPSTWATDAAYDAAGKAWDGLPPILVPPSGLKAEGWEPGQAPNARFLNWVLNNFGSWLAYLGETAVPGTVVVPAHKMIFEAPSGTQKWVIEGSGASGNAPRARPIVDHADAWIFADLPIGATLTTIEIVVSAHASRATTTDRWNVRAWERAWDWAPAITAPVLTELGSIQNDGSGTGLRLITFSGLSTVIAAGNDYPIWVQAPNSVGASDHLLAARLSYTAPRIA